LKGHLFLLALTFRIARTINHRKPVAGSHLPGAATLAAARRPLSKVLLYTQNFIGRIREAFAEQIIRRLAPLIRTTGDSQDAAQ
jgi:hypothetical protein